MHLQVSQTFEVVQPGVSTQYITRLRDDLLLWVCHLFEVVQVKPGVFIFILHNHVHHLVVDDILCLWVYYLFVVFQYMWVPHLFVVFLCLWTPHLFLVFTAGGVHIYPQ